MAVAVMSKTREIQPARIRVLESGYADLVDNKRQCTRVHACMHAKTIPPTRWSPTRLARKIFAEKRETRVGIDMNKQFT